MNALPAEAAALLRTSLDPPWDRSVFVATGQSVFVQLFADAAAAVQLAAGSGVGPVIVTGHAVVIQLFPPLPVAGVQDAEAIGVGPVTTLPQVVFVQLFPALADEPVQVPVGTLLVLFGVQVVAV